MAARELSPIKQAQLEFWRNFAEQLRARSSTIRPTKPTPHHWMTMALGRHGVNLVAIATSAGEPELRVEVGFVNAYAKTWFRTLMAKRSEIELAYGATLEWHDPAEANSCRVYARKPFDLLNREEWTTGIDWLIASLQRLREVFAPLVRELPASEEVEATTVAAQ